ncbi:MAG TPA: tetratricopeptide repeat protein [Polyangiaceae bacterium]|nr:tetratricopeptide repeat protein [Polyangiaceae bacterium]
MILPPKFRLPLLGGLFFVALSLSSPARADEDATTTAAARERFKEGVTYFDQKQYEKARAAFVQAYALKKHPSVLLNLAHSELRSNHERDAAQHFAQYLREATDAAPDQREAAQAGLTSAKAAVCEVTVTTDAEAEVLVDGASQGAAPLLGSLFLEPGAHTLQAKKGDRVVTQNVTAKAGETREIKLKLGAEAAPALAAKPATQPQKEPAQENPSETAAEVQVAPKGKREPFIHWLLTKPAGVISGGATVLLGGGAIGFSIASSMSYSEADDVAKQIDERAGIDGVSTQGICTDPEAVLGPGSETEAAHFRDACAHRQDAVDRGDSYKTVATVVGIGSGVMAVTTVVLYFTTAERQSPSQGVLAKHQVAFVPWVSGGKGGLSISGRF